ncbi:hypothetical protein EYF80_054042 [Liparis tanakae]|uniref:Uncharacterized protein n=1 Tax=Liparis tanakae TaxID=230148 RepID=A0A4Z2F402_9TELE|nr:hypothetical protein EYF80_054042 [Liparis tanakae]
MQTEWGLPGGGGSVVKKRSCEESSARFSRLRSDAEEFERHYDGHAAASCATAAETLRTAIRSNDKPCYSLQGLAHRLCAGRQNSTRSVTGEPQLSPTDRFTGGNRHLPTERRRGETQEGRATLATNADCSL